MGVAPPARAAAAAPCEPGERVLDLGCGAGRFVAALRDAGAEPVGVELAEAALERARRNVPGADLRRVAADGTLPLGHGEVDVVWCSEVLEHVPDTIAFLTEVRRVLRRGGRLLVTVPDHGRVKRLLIALGHHDAHYDPLGQHVRFYTRRSLGARAARHRLHRRADRAARRAAAAAQRARRARGQGLAGGSAAGWPFARLASRKSDVEAGLRGSRK